MYFRARYYDPEREAFISQDPMGDAQRYVSGNPFGLIDPLGLQYLKPAIEEFGPAAGAAWAGNELGKHDEEIGEATSQCADKLSCAFVVGTAKAAYEVTRANSKQWERDRIGYSFNVMFPYGGDSLAKKLYECLMRICFAMEPKAKHLSILSGRCTISKCI